MSDNTFEQWLALPWAQTALDRAFEQASEQNRGSAIERIRIAIGGTNFTVERKRKDGEGRS